MTGPDLKSIYARALQACAPQRLVARVVTPDMPRAIAGIGKCAGALLDGIGEFDDAFVAIPEGYPEPRSKATVVRGGHPHMNASSFAAGRALIDFVGAHNDITFLISGGGSACVDSPLHPWFSEDELIAVNTALVASGAPIGEINCVRKHLSAIKGGRLGALVRGRAVTLVYSDVSAGALADVASGPTLPDPTTKRDAITILERVGGFGEIARKLRDDALPETMKRLDRSRVTLVADNDTLTAAAASIAQAFGLRPVRLPQQIECDVNEATAILLRHANALEAQEVLVAGGEPTVVAHGDGRGGRCSELAVRLALSATIPLRALFGSSDGVDGNSGAAGIALTLPASLDAAAARRELERSNSFAVASSIGEVLPMAPSGNNLRDLYLLARS